MLLQPDYICCSMYVLLYRRMHPISHYNIEGLVTLNPLQRNKTR